MQPSHRHILFVGALLCLVALVAACGGGGPAQRETPIPEGAGQTGTQVQPTASTFSSPLEHEASPLPAPVDVTEPDTGEAPQELPVPTSPTVPTPSSPYLQGLLAEAKEDLAKRLDMPTDQIDLVELSPVVWPDGGMGCPEPGVAYTQVQVEGLLIRLRAGKLIYPYHSGGGTAPFLCEQAIEGATPQ